MEAVEPIHWAKHRNFCVRPPNTKCQPIALVGLSVGITEILRNFKDFGLIAGILARMRQVKKTLLLCFSRGICQEGSLIVKSM